MCVCLGVGGYSGVLVGWGQWGALIGMSLLHGLCMCEGESVREEGGSEER